MFRRLEIAVPTLMTLLFVVRGTAVFGHDSDSDGDGDDDLSPVRTCAGCRMSAFFAKLNALRREHRERRRTSSRRPTFWPATSVRRHGDAAGPASTPPPPPEQELRYDHAAAEAEGGSTAKEGRVDVASRNGMFYDRPRFMLLVLKLS